MDYVLVQTENGIEVGKIILGPKMMKFEELGYEPKAILRKLNEEDKMYGFKMKKKLKKLQSTHLK